MISPSLLTSLPVSLVLTIVPQSPWFEGSFDEALAAAAKQETLVALYFTMDGSDHCARMNETLAMPSVEEELASLICLQVEATSADGATLLARYGVKTVPTLQFVDARGQAEDALLGFHDGEPLIAELVRIRAGLGTLGALRRALEKDPEDLELRLQLALKLQHVGDEAGYQRELAVVHERDPEGETLAGARVGLWIVMSEVRASASDPNQSATFDLEPMRKHLAGVRHAPVLLEGWEWVAQVEQMRGDRSAARAALVRAWPEVAPEDRVPWARQTVYSFFSMRDELDGAERAFTLQLAESALARGREQKLSPERMASVHVSHARALVMNGRSEEALAETRRALELAPDLTEGHMFLGWLEES